MFIHGTLVSLLDVSSVGLDKVASSVYLEEIHQLSVGSASVECDATNHKHTILKVPSSPKEHCICTITCIEHHFKKERSSKE